MKITGENIVKACRIYNSLNLSENKIVIKYEYGKDQYFSGIDDLTNEDLNTLIESFKMVFTYKGE